MNRYLNPREWLEAVYANGYGPPVDYAAALLDDMDGAPWDAAATGLIENLAYRMDLVEPKDSDDVDRFEEDIMCINNEYREIVRVLKELGAIDENSDIPATLKMLIGPS